MYKVLKRNKKLLQVAKTVFGNIVSTAYVAVSNYNSADITDGTRKLIKMSENAIEKLSNGSIDIDDTDIIIVFNNNSVVSFTCSEWATISAVSLENIKNKRD